MQEIKYETRSGNDTLSPETATLILNAASWSRYLAIVGFIFLAIMFVGIITAGATITGMNRYAAAHSVYAYNPGVFSWTTAIVSLILLALYFVPMWYLYSFSTRIKKAFSAGHETTLNDAVGSLYKHYAFIGVVLTVWLLALVFGVITFVIAALA